MLRLLLNSRTPRLLLCMATLWHLGKARVLTEIQAGPLYRVVGSRLAISCNVSGFADVESRKEFEFRVTKPAKPIVLNIVSTSDPRFGYTVYRARGRDIALTHVSPNSVLFEIQSLRKDDEGEYDCAVINPEYVHDGIYSVKTVVKVIDDSLSASSAVSASQRKNEGEALALTCRASSNTIQHTHLSVAWYLRNEGDDDERLIVSLDRDFTLRPGPTFQGRYLAGLLRLDKIGEATYKLTMGRLEASDAGRVYCRAQEWIEEPDLSWYSLTQKTAEETVLHVKGRELAPDKVSVVVRLSAQQTSLQEGQELLLKCSVDTQKPEEKFFSVVWLRAGVELARIGPTGVVSVRPEYARQEEHGELRASRVGYRDYRLVLQPVSTGDQGEYVCRVWPQERGQRGAFVQGEPQDSDAIPVSISATASGLSVEMQRAVLVNEGDTLKLACKVHGSKGQLSVIWQRKVAQMLTFANLIGLSQEGVLETAAVEVANFVRATRPAEDVFLLELDEITLADSGGYQCVVSEWNSRSKTNSHSVQTTLTVASTDSFVDVNLISRKNVVTVGDNVELMCRVRGPRLAVTLTWSLQRSASAVDNILTMYSDGAVSWSGELERFHLRVDNKPSERIYYLLINGASHREAGSYQCRVSVFQKNAYKKLSPSNTLAVMVQNPASDLIVTPTPALTRDVSSDITIKCSVTSSRSGSSRYSVTWILQQHTRNVSILSSDRDSSITSTADRSRRLSMRRTKGPHFELTIRDSQISDQGVYVCQVVEWLQDPRGEWYHLPSVSGSSRLTLIEPDNNLLLDDKEKQIIAQEGDEVQLACELISGSCGDSCSYKVTWFYSRRGSSYVNAPLLELDHMGVLRYPETKDLRGLQGRIRLSRSDRSNFGLEIQRLHEQDSGSYWCQVEQYQLGNEGHWEQKGSVDGGPVMLLVNLTDNSLSIIKEELEFNVSTSEDFTIPCHITKQSSLESKFQVTWFWQMKKETERQPVFTSYRNATLEDFWSARLERLRFGHALPDQFSLTVLKPTPWEGGLYSCEVEEWLPSLSHGWRRAAVERSGYSTVTVYSQGESETRRDCQSGTWISVSVAVGLCSLLIITVLVLKLRKAKSTEKKSGQSLWKEQHHLTTKFSADDSATARGEEEQINRNIVIV
ncbi:immunoglobulin superfamily member 3-like isoform X2 [Syngnathoides biaculeatus]|uniref:immunoglobulin superfamily member 3-like isoform X2 n=1 Tax=Syngnathoides biaculeatus TaxID=300417 RepID=UPI002ADD7D29|nr:immunoglobulin superfamily member 3-like isoform X2 [Syngnathoides biaculeatus]